MQNKPDDASRLAAAAGGERQALEQIYLAYKDDLLTLAGLMLGDRQAAEDVLHDVFVSLARQIGRLRLTGSLKGYLLTSCANRARDLLRRRGTRHNPAGKHTIRVAFTATAAKNAPGKPVRAVSNPVVIEVISAKEIAARPERLKSQKNAFELRLAYHGPRDNPNQSGVENPIRSLILHTTLVDYDLMHGWSAVQISEEQAARIIDHLQADGSLVDALPFTDDHPPPDLDGPAYSLTVKGPENLVLYKPVGWGLGVLDFLERLQMVLDGEAAKAVDQMMAALGPQRKEWEAVAKWGRAVEGVQVRLRAEKPMWKPGTTPLLRADVRNLGTRNLLVHRAGNFWTSSELEIDGRWYRRALPEHNYRPPLSDLVPGRQFDRIPVDVGTGWSAVDAPSRDAGETGVTLSNGRLRLAPGKHTIRVAPTMPLKGNRPGDHVRAISNPVEIEVVAKSDKKVGATPEGNGEDTVLSMVLDGDSLWIATAAGLRRYRVSRGLVEKVNNKAVGFKTGSHGPVVAKAAGRIWFSPPWDQTGTGIYCLEEDRQDWKCEIPDTSGRCFAESGDLVWIGTREGLLRYNTRTDRQKLFTTHDGLAANNVTSVAVDDRFIWVGTASGISRLDKAAFETL